MQSGSTKRLLVLGLDGFEISIAQALMADGRMPHFKALFERSAAFALDHGEARDSGLSWEHFCTGKHPDDYRRWSAVSFDPQTYEAIQAPWRFAPFTDTLPGNVVIFDVPYHRLDPQSNVQGMVNWGAHDPGVERQSNPAGLEQEIIDRFGDYPAREYIYAFVWPDAKRTAEMADKITLATRKRGQILDWLLTERIPDWDTAIVTVSEPHSALEALWHGWDETHPLHRVESAAHARRGIVSLHLELDKMLGRCCERFADATIVAFTMHGMGSNYGDVASMALLPELLFRLEFGQPNLQGRRDWLSGKGDMLGRKEDWSSSVNAMMRFRSPDALTEPGATRQNWPRFMSRLADRIAGRKKGVAAHDVPVGLPWMPCSRYAPFWPRMRAFALPAFYDGQIRLNVVGREKSGLVRPDRIGRELDALEQQLLKITDGITGEPVVGAFRRPTQGDPMSADPSQCDLIIKWNQASVAFDHPAAGRIGPLPFRRTGGHTGDAGFAWIAGPGIEPVSGGRRDALDLPATVARLAGIEPAAWQFSGSDLLADRHAAA